MIAHSHHRSYLATITVAALLIAPSHPVGADPTSQTVEEGRLFVARTIGEVVLQATNPDGLTGEAKVVADATNKKTFEAVTAFTQRNQELVKNLQPSEKWLDVHRREILFAMNKPDQEERDAFLMYILFDMFPRDRARGARVYAYDQSKTTGSTVPYEDPADTVNRLILESNRSPQRGPTAPVRDAGSQEPSTDQRSPYDAVIAKALGKDKSPAVNVAPEAATPSTPGTSKKTEDYTLAWIVGGIAVIIVALKAFNRMKAHDDSKEQIVVRTTNGRTEVFRRIPFE